MRKNSKNLASAFLLLSPNGHQYPSALDMCIELFVCQSAKRIANELLYFRAQLFTYITFCHCICCETGVSNQRHLFWAGDIHSQLSLSKLLSGFCCCFTYRIISFSGCITFFSGFLKKVLLKNERLLHSCDAFLSLSSNKVILILICMFGVVMAVYI